MTEAEWMVCSNPLQMMEHVRDNVRVGRAEGRKDYLLAVGSFRLVWPALEEVWIRRAVDWAEEFADDTDDPNLWGRLRDEIEAKWAGAKQAYYDTYRISGRDVYRDLAPAEIAHWLIQKLPRVATGCAFAPSASGPPSHPQGPLLIRDIFGNPFRPATFSPAWRTDTAVSLARQMYESRDFSAMPILADALQDAGCDNDDILNHCQNGGPHVRGCWVVDLLLEKT
jgi:hypothetical protein